MPDHFKRLEERVRELGNHHRKYLRAAAAHLDPLVERLERAGAIDEVHLWSAAPDVREEMHLVREMGGDRDEQLAFLGCYFALQLLNLNVRAVDVLRLRLAARNSRTRVYREFMLKVGSDLRRLTSSYMEQLLDIFLDPERRPRFVICGVGTRADQDDLDLGIVDDGSEHRAHFNHAIGKLQREMLRRAIPLHFHLSEHVGEQGFAASIAEYTELLDTEIQDFIIITEMLGARPIIGNQELFERFTREVTGRYFYRPDGDNRFHEGYLRGMLGEIRSLLLGRLRRHSIEPKRDALRVIKGLVYVQKTVFGIREVNAWDVLHQLVSRYPRHGQLYERLEEALSFIEVFRFLYQLLEVQEEEILLEDEESRARLERVAVLMGYEGVGVVRPHDHLLIHYHEHVQAAREVAAQLMDDARRHLEQISVFSEFLRSRAAPRQRGSGNLAVDFVTSLRFFRGTRYWDDVMQRMESDTALLRSFVDDFDSLPDTEREVWIRRYAKWGEVTSIALLRYLVILYENRRRMGSGRLFRDLSRAFIDRLEGCPDVVPRLSAVFHHYPRLVNDFLVGLPENEIRRFMGLFEREAFTQEVEERRLRLLHFCRLHCCSSHYFKRFFQRIVHNLTEYVEDFHRPEELRMVAEGILGRIDTLEDLEEKKRELGNYYDLEFLRVGLQCLEGTSSQVINAEFTAFCDEYLQRLFDVCKQEVDQQTGHRVRARDLLAIYSAGGHARKLAFDDDHDLIILLNSGDPEVRRYGVRIITRMNREIVRRGTMPHYRFAERFGEYVTTFSELRTLFADPDETAFIDMSQLVGARRVVGSSSFEAELRDEIIEPYIFSRSKEFTAQVVAEIRSRHAAVEAGTISAYDIKETRGGLRDIELVLLVLMVREGVHHPVCHELLRPLSQRLPQLADQLGELFAAFTLLNRVRDVYRLTVAAEDVLLPEETAPVAQVLGMSPDGENGDGGGRVAAVVEETLDL